MLLKFSQESGHCSNHEVTVNDLLVNNHLNVSHQLHSLSQSEEYQAQYRPRYNHTPAVAQVEEHQGPDSVKQANTEQVLTCAVPENS